MNQLALQLDPERLTNQALVIQALATCRGKANGVSVRELMTRTGLKDRPIREAVSDLDIDGLAVCSHPSYGYFIATSLEELELCAEFLESRALHGLKRAARLRKFALPDILGQQRLPT